MLNLISTRAAVAVSLCCVCVTPTLAQTSEGKSLNPAISLIISGGLNEYKNDSNDYTISGLPLLGEAGLNDEGFALGEAELVMDSNIDDRFYGKATIALHQDGEELEVELEEAFFRTLTLPYGLTFQGGKFFSEIGYLNPVHGHAWDFVDAPLLYRGLFGRQLIDTGLQLTWLAPTEQYLQFGAEWLRGNGRSDSSDFAGKNAITTFITTGGDFNRNSSWQLGVSGLFSGNGTVELGGHAHGEGEAEADAELTGDTRLYGLDFVYKWALNGNPRSRNFKLQTELFRLQRDGDISINEPDGIEETTLNNDASGFYVQGIYQFMPKWRVGLRYDRLEIDNNGSDAEVLAEAGYEITDHNPNRVSAMLDYSHSEFSRLRIQLNSDRSNAASSDTQIYLQYIMSLGSHGAHRY